MRAKEFSLLNELKMSPTYLQKVASKVPGAIAGIEFEMIVPGQYGDDSSEPEYDYDQDRRAESINDIVDFFSDDRDGNINSDRVVARLEEKLRQEYWEWIEDKIDEAWYHSSDGWEFFQPYFEKHWYDSETDDDLAKATEEAWDDRGRSFDDAYDSFRYEFTESFSDEDFCKDKDVTMLDIYNSYDLQWPHLTYTGGDDLNELADSFQRAVWTNVSVSSSYHGVNKSTKAYMIEPDSSIEPDDTSSHTGLEFVSPPQPLAKTIQDLGKVVEWAKRNNCYTNESCGLHMNVSVPEFHKDTVDYVKLALFIGDQYILEQFGRAGNSFCTAAINKIKNRAEVRPELATAALNALRTQLNTIAGSIIHKASTDKYTSLHMHDEYVEVRSPGGDWLNTPLDKLVSMLYRITVALQVACNPNMYKEEYAKKLYKLLTSQGNEDATSLFSQFAAGKLDKQGLKVLWAERVMRNPGTNTAPLANRIMNSNNAKSWWEVGFMNPNYNEVTSSDKFAAKTAAEAIGYARTKWNIPAGRYPDNTFVTKRLGTFGPGES